MSVRDTSWTNPDNLRSLYKSPRNPLRDLEDLTPTANQGLIAPPPSQPPNGIPGGGGGGTGHGGTCPAVGQFTLVRIAATTKAVRPVLVEEITTHDWLWNPIANTFRPVIACGIIENVECVIYRTFAGAESVVSLTQPVIQHFKDEQGIQIVDLINDPDAVHKAVSCIDFTAVENQIEWIKTAGKRNVVHISLEAYNEFGDGIYVSGTDPLKTNLIHNKPPEGQRGEP